MSNQSSNIYPISYGRIINTLSDDGEILHPDAMNKIVGESVRASLSKRILADFMRKSLADGLVDGLTSSVKIPEGLLIIDDVGEDHSTSEWRKKKEFTKKDLELIKKIIEVKTKIEEEGYFHVEINFRIIFYVYVRILNKEELIGKKEGSSLLEVYRYLLNFEKEIIRDEQST